MSAKPPPGLEGYENGKIPRELLTPVGGGHYLYGPAAQQYLALKAAAAAEGITIGLTDSYRSYDQQVDLAKRKGLSSQGGYGAVPGTSEHGWGMAFDVKTNAKGQAWLAAHGADYGFSNTAGAREPWHWGQAYQGGTTAAAAATTHGPGQSATLRTAATATSSGDSLTDTTRELYGWMAAYLDMPVIGDILRKAATLNYTPARLQGALEQTDWWKTTQASVREWDAKRAEDPATAETLIQQRMAEIQARAATAGFSIDPTHLHDMATTALRLGWSEQQETNAIGAEAFRGGTLNNSTTMQMVRSAAGDYAVPLSDHAMTEWGRKIATGESTTEDYRQYLVTLAKGQFEGLAGRIDQGHTVKQLADPYIQIASQTLGVTPDSIDLRDPKWIAALNAVDDKNQVRAMTLQEWQRKLRSDPVYGWTNTKDAKDQAYAFGAMLGQTFGTYAGTR